MAAVAATDDDGVPQAAAEARRRDQDHQPQTRRLTAAAET